MASDPMLDDLRGMMGERSSLSMARRQDLSEAFISTHGPALLAKLEAMEKVVEKAVENAVAEAVAGAIRARGQS